MTNRDVLKKFMLQTFNIKITDEFHIRCNEMSCIESQRCSECPGEVYNDFWDKEFVGDENVQINGNERVAIKEISW